MQIILVHRREANHSVGHHSKPPSQIQRLQYYNWAQRIFNGSLNSYRRTTQNDIGGGLHILEGFYSSVRRATGRLLVNVNAIVAVFNRPEKSNA